MITGPGTAKMPWAATVSPPFSGSGPASANMRALETMMLVPLPMLTVFNTRNGVLVPASDSLALSDLVLGRDGAGLTWQSATGPVRLNPLDAFPPKGSAELYYELHGATPDSTYQTDIEVKGVYGDAKGTVHLTFKETASTQLIRTRRSIGLDKLEEGQYQVTVTVTEQGTGRTAVQSRYLNVRE